MNTQNFDLGAEYIEGQMLLSDWLIHIWDMIVGTITGIKYTANYRLCEMC